MKKKYLISASILSLLVCINTYASNRTNSSNTDWDASEVWSDGNIPDTSGEVAYFYTDAVGTTTILDRETADGQRGEMGLLQLKMQAGNLEVKNTTLTIKEWFSLGAENAGTAENPYVSNIVLNNSYITAQRFYSGDRAYTESNFTLSNNSEAYFKQLGDDAFTMKDNSKTTINIEKGSSFIIETGTTMAFVKSGSTNCTTILNIKGNFTAGRIAMEKEATNPTAIMNIYGSANVTISNEFFVGSYSQINFILQDVSASHIASTTAGILNEVPTSFLLNTNLTTSKVEEGAMPFTIDLKDFSVQGTDYVEGQTYAIGIASSSKINSSICNIINEDLMGDEWELFDNELQEYEGNVYLMVTYLGSYIPEPSTYAAIFGALALGFVVYKRRK